MARTKKYLSSKSLNKKVGFYRPIKRLNSRSSKTSQQTSKSAIPSVNIENQSDFTQEIQNLKIKTIAEKKKKQEEDDFPKLKPLSPKAESNSIPEIKIDLDSGDLIPSQENSVDFTTHDQAEETDFITRQLDNSIEQKSELAKKLAKLKEQYEEEKRLMQSEINTLRKDLHRTEPINHNKFFSISKELSDVVKEMDKLVNSESFTVGITSPDSSPTNLTKIEPQRLDFSTPTLSPTPITQTNNQAQVIVTEENKTPEDTAKENPPQAPIPADQVSAPSTPSIPPNNNPAKSKRKIPKIFVILGSTLVIIALLVGIVWFSVSKKTDVSQQLLQEYLPQDAQPSLEQDLEKKIEQSISDNLNPSATPQGETKGASDTKYVESQADVPFSDTYWDTVTNPSLGITLNFPKNTVNMINTETSTTFIRKNGYIFKVQLIESALTVEEYWKLIKASSLNYKVKETTFRNYPALFLELEDFSEYPGDRYLVKKGDFIYDIWYATYNKNLSDEDAKRIDIMLNSFEFIEN